MGYFLGIDGGGSKTAVWCADEHGVVIGKGMAGPTNLTTTESELACQNLSAALKQAASRVSNPRYISVVMGLAGADTPTEITTAKQVFSPVLLTHGITDFKLINDAIIALKSGSDAANAMVAIAGTGSNCFGRNALGETASASGLDYWLSDEGSGFMIGQQALRAVVKAHDGRGSDTTLTQMILDHFRVASVLDLKSVLYSAEFSKREMAAVTILVVKAAESGDLVAYNIMMQTVTEIQKMVHTVAKKLYSAETSFDAVLVGSVNTIALVRERMRIWFAQQLPQARLIYPDKPPVYGALQLAYRDAFLADVSGIR